MGKKLSEMTLQELCKLFPIFLEPHNAVWAKNYAEMQKFLTEKSNNRDILRICHIGSTAIPNIQAKPIVDILVEIPRDKDIKEVAAEIEKLGFLKMSESDTRVSFNYGYTERGFADKVFHLHLRFAGDNDELYFRDYLLDNPDVAKEYEKLKIGLAREFEHDRDGYTAAKTDLVKHYTELAKTLYADRYRIK